MVHEQAFADTTSNLVRRQCDGGKLYFLYRRERVARASTWWAPPPENESICRHPRSEPGNREGEEETPLGSPRPRFNPKGDMRIGNGAAVYRSARAMGIKREHLDSVTAWVSREMLGKPRVASSKRATASGAAPTLLPLAGEARESRVSCAPRHKVDTYVAWLAAIAP